MVLILLVETGTSVELPSAECPSAESAVASADISAELNFPCSSIAACFKSASVS